MRSGKEEFPRFKRFVPRPDEKSSHDGLDETIKKTHSYLFKTQKESKYWVGELIVDATLVADMVAFHHWDGSVDPIWQEKAVNHIFSMQTEEGGWSIYYGGPAEVNATIKCYLALKLAGVPITDTRMLRAREMAVHLGGVPRMNTFSKLYLALLGLYPWEYVPTIPCEILLIGKWFYVNFNEMSSWSRAMLVPLAIINHYRPVRTISESFTIEELFPEGFHERDLRLPKDPSFCTWRNFFLMLDRFIQIVEKLKLRPFRKLSLKKAEKWMLERFEGSEGLAAIFPAMLNSLIALKCLGYSDDHPQVIRAREVLKNLEHETPNSVRIEPCFSPVWDTAIVAIAMRESGVPANHPSMVNACNWLISKEIRFRGDWVYKNPVDVEPSGWVFEHENKWYPDVDDTAMVLLALRLIPTDKIQTRDECYKRGLNWMVTFQCKDGGWAAFDKDCTRSILEKVPFADHNAMLDPECPDITARILEVLGKESWDLDHPQIAKALDYLRRTQEEDGSWYGRWGVNYIYGTWQVLRGLASLGVNFSEPWIQKAKDWLISVQNDDGGWGERCNTYDDPVYKGQGPSTPSQTAWAVMGLLAFEDPDEPALRDGVEFLIQNQNPDGTWTEHETTGTGFPKVFYLKYDLYRISWPLLALGNFQSLLKTEGKIESKPIINKVTAE